MKRTWTIIGVSDVPGSFKWRQALFRQLETRPAHDYFGQLLDSDGTVLLCLHQWGAHEQRARALVERLEEEPHVNPNTGTKEFSLRDPDGYYVTISALSAA
jgi:hypothetical protein